MAVYEVAEVSGLHICAAQGSFMVWRSPYSSEVFDGAQVSITFCCSGKHRNLGRNGTVGAMTHSV